MLRNEHRRASRGKFLRPPAACLFSAGFSAGLPFNGSNSGEFGQIQLRAVLAARKQEEKEKGEKSNTGNAGSNGGEERLL